MTVGFQLRTRPGLIGWAHGSSRACHRWSRPRFKPRRRQLLPRHPLRGARPPPRVGVWHGERDATPPGPPAAQPAYPPPMDTVLPSSVAPGDDYLNVSVWAPAEGDSRPVMVRLPGGAFVRGANS